MVVNLSVNSFMLEVYRVKAQSCTRAGDKEGLMSELSTTKVEESVQQYVKLALEAPTREERDRYVRKAAELARSQDVTWRASLKKVG
jgi:hypothetical protein